MADEIKSVQIRLERNEHGVFNEMPFSFTKGQEVEVHPDLARELVRLERAVLIAPSAKKETATAKQQNKETR